MSSVMAANECPSIRWMTSTLAPSLTASDCEWPYRLVDCYRQRYAVRFAVFRSAHVPSVRVHAVPSHANPRLSVLFLAIR